MIFEGGGVKCAYEFGVLKTLWPYVMDYDAAAGASFGALNAALLLGGGIERMSEFWSSLSAEEIFEDKELQSIMEKMYRNERFVDPASILYLMPTVKDPVAAHRSISQKYLDFVISCVDEAAIRNCGRVFGLVAVKLDSLPDPGVNPLAKLMMTLGVAGINSRLPEGMSALQHLCELTADEIPNGELAEFVAASACFPAFTPIKIGDHYYIDGGVSDNTPIKMMEDRGYSGFLCIRTNTGAPKKRWSDGANIDFITPSRELGSSALFSRENISELIALGEYDASKYLEEKKMLFGETL